MNTIFDSTSALLRFKSRHALHVSSPNHTSSYIVICKIKKILNREFTDEVFEQYFTNQGFSRHSRGKMNRSSKLGNFVDRLERLDIASMKLILDEYEENGIHGMLEYLTMPVAKLVRLTKKHGKAEVY